jgi:hypothetical protein
MTGPPWLQLASYLQAVPRARADPSRERRICEPYKRERAPAVVGCERRRQITQVPGSNASKLNRSSHSALSAMEIAAFYGAGPVDQTDGALARISAGRRALAR